MSLISIIVCLFLDRSTSFGDKLRNYTWFNQYFIMIDNWLADSVLWKCHWLGLVATLLPLLLAIVFIQVLLSFIFWGVFGYLFNLLALFYCLGKTDLQALFAEYFVVKSSKASSTSTREAAETNSEPTQAANPKTEDHNICEEMLWQGNKQIVAIVFWFVLFGAAGAIIYRALSVLREQTLGEEAAFVKYVEVSRQAVGIVDWLPTRLLAFGYALAGNFVITFKYWLSNIYMDINHNKQFLAGCGMAAISNHHDSDKEKLAIELFERAVIIWLGLLGLMTISAWIS